MEYCYYNCKCHSWLAFYSMHNELILGKKCNLKGDPSRIFPQKNELGRTIFFRVFLAHCREGRQTKGCSWCTCTTTFSFKRFLIYLLQVSKVICSQKPGQYKFCSLLTNNIYILTNSRFVRYGNVSSTM